MTYISHYTKVSSAVSILQSGHIHGDLDPDPQKIVSCPHFWVEERQEVPPSRLADNNVRLVFYTDLQPESINTKEMPKLLIPNTLYLIEYGDLINTAFILPGSVSHLVFLGMDRNPKTHLDRSTNAFFERMAREQVFVQAEIARNIAAANRLHAPRWDRPFKPASASIARMIQRLTGGR